MQGTRYEKVGKGRSFLDMCEQAQNGMNEMAQRMKLQEIAIHS